MDKLFSANLCLSNYISIKSNAFSSDISPCNSLKITIIYFNIARKSDMACTVVDNRYECCEFNLEFR